MHYVNLLEYLQFYIWCRKVLISETQKDVGVALFRCDNVKTGKIYIQIKKTDRFIGIQINTA